MLPGHYRIPDCALNADSKKIYIKSIKKINYLNISSFRKPSHKINNIKFQRFWHQLLEPQTKKLNWSNFRDC